MESGSLGGRCENIKEKGERKGRRGEKREGERAKTEEKKKGWRGGGKKGGGGGREREEEGEGREKE